jgi:hypothetical protein
MGSAPEDGGGTSVFRLESLLVEPQSVPLKAAGQTCSPGDEDPSCHLPLRAGA